MEPSTASATGTRAMTATSPHRIDAVTRAGGPGTTVFQRRRSSWQTVSRAIPWVVGGTRVAQMRVEISGYADSDAEERAELARRLESELSELDVEEVVHPADEVPSGAKGDAVQWAQLAVTFAGSLPALIGGIRGFVGRHPGAAVCVEIDGDRLSLGEARTDEQRALVEAWIARHGG
jgi:hypothetical protein